MASPHVPFVTYRVQHLARNTDKLDLLQALRLNHLGDMIYAYLAEDRQFGDDSLTATLTIPEDAVSHLSTESDYFVRDKRIKLDSEFAGFTPLSSNDRSKDCVDVVAITGMGGKPFASWQIPDGSMWLRDRLPRDVPGIQTHIYGYRSAIAKSLSNARLQDFTDHFTSGLWAYLRPDVTRSRPLVLVGHSLGCLIIKQMLVEYTDQPQYQALLNRLHAIVLFGAPHRGLEIDALEELTRGKPPHGLVTDLGPQSTILRDLSKKFSAVSKHLAIITCYELQDTPTARQREGDPDAWDRDGPPKRMVDTASACLYTSNEERISIDKNHSMIAKLSDHATAYKSLRTSLEQHAARGHVVLKAKLHRANMCVALRRICTTIASLWTVLGSIDFPDQRSIVLSLQRSKTFFDGFLRSLEGDLATVLLVYGQSSSRPSEFLFHAVQELEAEYLPYQTLCEEFERRYPPARIGRPGNSGQGSFIASLQQSSQYASILRPERLANLCKCSERCIAMLDKIAGLVLQGLDDSSFKQIRNMESGKTVGLSRAVLRTIALRASQEKNQIDSPLSGTLAGAELNSSPKIRYYNEGSKLHIPVIVESRILCERRDDVQMSLSEAERIAQVTKKNKRKTGRLVHVLRCLRPEADSDGAEEEPDPRMLVALGYLEDETANTLSLIFALPALPAGTAFEKISTLKDKLNDPDYQPSLGQRFNLARAVCASILGLHCWGWIHKDIRSANILLVPANSRSLNTNADNTEGDEFTAYLCGFDVARSEADLSDWTATMDLEGMFYRHPERQGEPLRAANKVHDLYATGVVLVEIGMKKTVEKTFLPAFVDKSLRTGIMPKAEEIASKTRSHAMEVLRTKMGSAYANAVERCLTGNFGVVYDDEAKTELSMAFQELVLEPVEYGCRL